MTVKRGENTIKTNQLNRNKRKRSDTQLRKGDAMCGELVNANPGKCSLEPS